MPSSPTSTSAALPASVVAGTTTYKRVAMAENPSWVVYEAQGFPPPAPRFRAKMDERKGRPYFIDVNDKKAKAWQLPDVAAGDTISEGAAPSEVGTMTTVALGKPQQQQQQRRASAASSPLHHQPPPPSQTNTRARAQSLMPSSAPAGQRHLHAEPPAPQQRRRSSAMPVPPVDATATLPADDAAFATGYRFPVDSEVASNHQRDQQPQYQRFAHDIGRGYAGDGTPTGLSSRQSTAAVTPVVEDDGSGADAMLLDQLADVEVNESVNRRALEDTALTAAAGFRTRYQREARDYLDAATATAEQGEHRRMIVNLEAQGRMDVDLSERSERILCRRSFDRTRRGLVELRDLADDEAEARRLLLGVEGRAWDATRTAFTAEREDLSLRQTLLPGPWARRQRALRSAEKEEAAHRAVLLRSEAAEYAYLSGRESRDVIHLLDHDDAARASRMSALGASSSSTTMMMMAADGSIAQHYRDAALPDAIANDLFTSAVVNQRAAFCDHLLTTTALYQELVRAVCWAKPSYFLTPELAAYSGRHFERSFAVRASAVARVASHNDPHIHPVPTSAEAASAPTQQGDAPPARVGWRDWLRGDVASSASTVAPGSARRENGSAEHDLVSPSRLKPIPRLPTDSSPRRRVDFSMRGRSVSASGAPTSDGAGDADAHGHALQVHHERMASTKPVALCLMTPPVNAEVGRAKDREAASFAGGSVAHGANVPQIHDNAASSLPGFDRGTARYAAVARGGMEAKALAILPGGQAFGSVRTRRSARTGVLAASVRFEFDREQQQSSGGVDRDRADVVALGVSAQDGAAFFGWRSDGALTTDMHRASPLRSYGTQGARGFTAGDIVTVMLDFNELTLSFAVNGDSCGAAFEFSAVDDPEPLFSTVLLCAGAKAELV